MRSKKVRKWMASALLLALAMTAIIPATGAAPPAQAPESVECGDSITCATAGNAVYVKNTGTGAAIYGHNTSTGDGLKGRGNPGVYGFSYHAAGVRGQSNQGVGVKGESVDKYGVQGTSSTSYGIFGTSEDLDGVKGTSTGAGIADNGVYGETNSTDNDEAGVYGYSTAEAAGVVGFNYNSVTTTTTSFGVRAYSRYGNGVYSQGGYASGDWGGYFTGYGGLRVDATGATEPGYGIYVTSQDAEAGYFSAVNDDGVYGRGDGPGFWGAWGVGDDSYGVYGNTNVAGGYGLYTGDKIYTGGGCVGCTSMLIAQNGGDTPLEPGDVVAVVGISQAPTEFYGRPVLTVQKADGKSSQGVVGVVEGRYVRQLLTKENARLETEYVEVPDPEGKSEPDRIPVEKLIEEEIVIEDAHTTTEPAAPGDYLTVVYRGLIQVKADASSGAIQVGDLLTSASASGWSVKAPATEATPRGAIIGKAVEPLAEGQGLIWVLVDLQ